MRRDSFRSVDGNRVTAVTAEEMRAVDRVATEDVGLDLLQLMENAGRTLAVAVRDHRQAGQPVVVLAGPGGNGGGGLAAARHLDNHGVPVSVLLDREPAALTGATARQADILAATDVAVGVDDEQMPDGALVVDALVGYGLDGPLRGTAAAMVDTIPPAATVISLDVPTGRDATTGAEPGPAVAPERVLTLARPKTGLVGLACPIVLADIAIPLVVYERLDLNVRPCFDGSYGVALEATASQA